MNDLCMAYKQALEETREELQRTREAYMKVVAAYNEATAVMAKMPGVKNHCQTLKVALL